MKKINNTTLLIAFLVLATIAGIFFMIDSRKGERSFRTDLFTVDSARVTTITIYPKGKVNQPIQLVKAGKAWEVKFNNHSYQADTATIQRIVQALSKIRAERVAATDKSGWKELEMTDSASARVVVSQGSETTADFRVGKISFSRNEGGYGGNQNFSAQSHIRVPDDDRVYVVDGFLSMMFGDNPSLYRNRMVFRFTKADVSTFTFIYPGDSSFQLVKSGTRWLMNDLPVDSAKVENWLNSIANCTSSDFNDENTQPLNLPYTLRIEGNNMKTIEVKGAYDAVKKIYSVNSTVNPAATFGGANSYLFNQVFPGKSRFIATKESPKKGKKK